MATDTKLGHDRCTKSWPGWPGLDSNGHN